MDIKNLIFIEDVLQQIRRKSHLQAKEVVQPYLKSQKTLLVLKILI